MDIYFYGYIFIDIYFIFIIVTELNINMRWSCKVLFCRQLIEKSFMTN